MKILIVEDEARMARLLRRGLQEEGHSVDVCETADAAAEQALLISYDVILLDWMLPDQDGVALLRSWRQKGLRTPVLMLTARGTTGEKVTGLRAGADDYMAKPFDFDELLARIEALARRGGAHERSAQLGNLTLDARRRVLQGPDGETPLTAREFELLSELGGHRGEVLTRSKLLSCVWGTEFEGSPNVVDVYIGYLRAKIEQLRGDGVSLQTVRGIGYRLVVDAQTEGSRR
ncbi:MAG: response regulator transcription factor [Myxococcales bacterium]|nr:response regulator transcription factor [Myxococcales bacterium]